jgi:CxxC motif-containing protein (DUF1111 family)
VAVGCAACHQPTLGPTHGRTAGAKAEPFTDLLLHDMGPGLADAAPSEGAGAAEWRTAPLWGLGRAAGRRAFLHDGRARTPLEAILWHGGEALAARERFAALSEAERLQLLRFLEGL